MTGEDAGRKARKKIADAARHLRNMLDPQKQVRRKAYLAEWRQRESSKAIMKALATGEARRKYELMYEATPERIAAKIAYCKTPARKAQNSEYAKSPQRKLKMKQYASSPAGRAQSRAIRHRRRVIGAHLLTELDEFVLLEVAELCVQRALATGFRWEVDHIVPVSKGGTNHAYNLQAVPMAWNRSKGNTHSRRFNI